MLPFASTTLIDIYLAVTRHISLSDAENYGRFTTILNNVNDLSTAPTRIGKLLLNVRKCMLMAVVETHDFLVYYVCGFAYILGVIFYTRWLFHARFLKGYYIWVRE